MPKTLLMDLDGTLVDSVPDLAASANRILAARGLAPFTRPEIAAMVGDGVAALTARFMQARSRTATQADTAAMLDDYLAHVADQTRPYPGIEPALDTLAAQGWTLAVCTNKPEAAARTLLTRLGLLSRFAFVGGGDTFPVRKPDPAHLLHTLAAAGGTPDRALLVGDHHNDVAAAAAAGLPCIFALWGYGPPSMGTTAAAQAAAPGDLPALAARLMP